MTHKPFQLYRRSLKKGIVYYAQFYDEYGDILPGRSTGQTTKSAAEAWCYEQFKKNQIQPQRSMRFSQYAQDWWIYDKCEYVQSRLARGRILSRRYVDEMRSILNNHILPYFKNRILSRINRPMIEEWIISLSKKDISTTTIDRCITCLGIMLNRAVELEKISRNPLIGIMRPEIKHKKRGILTIDEAKLLFQESSLNEIWDGDLMVLTANILSLTTGMRQGEILGLQNQYVYTDHIVVMWSWSKKYGLVVPKWGSRRTIPIPIRTAHYINELLKMSPFPEPESLVFFGQDKNKPLNDKTLSRGLYRALEIIGITEDERKERNITFHSWRHQFNTYMRGKVPDPKLQQVTGHRTVRMVDSYTHFAIEDFSDINEVQEKLFE